MKKKFLILFCLLAAGLTVWHLWPEYGSGYSEDQRRLWNRQRALYPTAWVLGRVSPRETYVRCFLGKDEKTVEELLKKKREKEEELIWTLERNRDRLGLACSVKAPTAVDSSRLPLEGLTEWEVVERALAGDGDACLRMVEGLCRENYRGVYALSWRQAHEAEKWLERAVALKRPGSVFLKELFAAIKSDRTIGKENEGYATARKEVKVDKIPGYADFCKSVNGGDYSAYRTAFFLLPGEEDFEKQKELIYKKLLEWAKQGKADSQSKLSMLFFEGDVSRQGGNDFQSLIWTDILRKTEHWENSLGWLPNSWKEKIVRGMFACGVWDAERTPTLERYREATQYARDAARQGDLTGMYLWVRYGITSQERFSVQDWNDILSYGRILFEAGYVPYIKAITENRFDSGAMRNEELNDAIYRSFYSKESYEKLRKGEYFKARGDVWAMIGNGSVEEVRKMMRMFRILGKTDYFLEDILMGTDSSAGGVMDGSSREVRDCLLEQIQAWAVEGDVHAMYRLAGIYEKGIYVPVDLGRAYTLYRQALAGARDCFRFSVILNDRAYQYDNVYQGVGFYDAICFKMAEMVLKHADFPGREEKEPYDLVLGSGRMDTFSGYHYYLLGQFHERGVGRPASREMALSFYRKGTGLGHYGCQQGETRMSAPQGKEKKGK